MTNRHIVPQDGQWAVRAPGADRASGVFDTQAEAYARAREIVNNAGGGEVVTHGRDGRIRDSSTIGRPDRFPPRG